MWTFVYRITRLLVIALLAVLAADAEGLTVASATNLGCVRPVQTDEEATLSSQVHVIKQRDGHLTCAGLLGSRDLTSYDVLSSPAIGNGSIQEISRIQVAAESVARSFIWDHWQQRRRGYTVVSFSSVDAVSTNHVLVEPDRNGRWQIVYKIVRHSGILDELPTIRQVRRVVRGRGPDEWITLSSDDACDPKGFKLEFFDDHGEFVTGW